MSNPYFKWRVNTQKRRIEKSINDVSYIIYILSVIRCGGELSPNIYYQIKLFCNMRNNVILLHDNLVVRRMGFRHAMFGKSLSKIYF